MLRCSAEAFARCPTRHLCERREDATFAEGSECDTFNRQVGERLILVDTKVSEYPWGYCPNCGAKMDGGTSP